MSSQQRAKPVIFVIGGPGSGKGTICDRLEKEYGFTHLSTGDLLRAEVASGSERGRALNQIMKSGQLISNAQMLSILQSAMEKHTESSAGFLLDGFPRDFVQAVEFEQQLGPCDAVLYVECSDEEMTRRALNRGRTSGRVDDNEATIRSRLETFHSHMKPILEHLKDRLFTVNGQQSVEAVFRDVEEALQRFAVKVPKK